MTSDPAQYVYQKPSWFRRLFPRKFKTHSGEVAKLYVERGVLFRCERHHKETRIYKKEGEYYISISKGQMFSKFDCGKYGLEIDTFIFYLD